MAEAGTVINPPSASPNPSQCYFAVGGLRLFAKRFGVAGGIPVLALHGWMDNCASFDLLAAQLAGCDVVCLDCAGHGLSSHRTHLGAYNIWQDIAELFSVANQLGWDKFALLGHSRGAMCSFLAAGTLPERISHLILIEGVYPPVAVAEEAPTNLESAIKSLLASQKRPTRYYDSFEQTVTARARGFVPVSEEDARLLALHGVQKNEFGYFWRYDYKLTVGSEVRLSFDQVMAFQARIEVETLVIAADKGLLVGNIRIEEALETFSQARIVRLEGDHHLHMHTQSTQVAQHILSYLFERVSIE